MQGVWEFSYKSSITDEHSNLINILVNGCGQYPNELFSSKASYEFSPFTDTSRMNNGEMLKYLVNLLKSLGYDVFVRNVSFLGLPAFHVVIPGLSEVEEIDEVSELSDYEEYINVKRLVRNMENATGDELTKLAGFLENKGFGMDTNILQLLNLPINKSLPWYYANINLFITAIYCRLGDYTKAFRTFSGFFDHFKHSAVKPEVYIYNKCMRDYLAARADGMIENEIIEMLCTFYPIQMVTGIIEELGDPERIFTKYGLIKCFVCEACRLKPYCQYEETERVFKAVKKRYAESSIKQEDLISLLK
jgi:ribosomal protein S12 methylthiotransferase accessory factor